MNIRQVRTKIKSVGNVHKITNALQMVSAIKMKKAQQRAIESLPYRQDLERIIKKVSVNINPELSVLLKQGEEKAVRDLTIVISSDKGMCGAFNFNLLRYLAKSTVVDKNDYLCVGRKAALYINKLGGTVTAEFPSVNALGSVSAIFQTAVDGFLQGKYKQVKIVFNRFINTLRHEPTEKLLLPIQLKEVETIRDGKEESEDEYKIEPSPQQIIDPLLRSAIEEKIRGAIIDSEASEHSARMIAMKNATDNAEDVIYNLTLLRNKLRQEKITYELLDMITAKESVEQG